MAVPGVGNEHYTIFATTPSKDRLSILDVLANRVYGCDGNPVEREYTLNETAYCHLEAYGVTQVTQRKLRRLPQNQMLCESEFLKLLGEHLPKRKGQRYDHVRHAAAIAAYQGQEDWPVVKLLLCDDAPQFKTHRLEAGTVLGA
jgi:hypothetical protein